MGEKKTDSTKTTSRSEEIDAKIIRFLYYSLMLNHTVYSIAKETGISQPTAKKYLKKLVDEGLVREIEITTNTNEGSTTQFVYELDFEIRHLLKHFEEQI